MENNMQEMVNSAVRQQLALQVLATIGTAQRDAILSRSIEEALSGYSFKSVIEKALAENAAVAVKGMLVSESWQKEINKTIQKALAELLEKLQPALLSALVESVIGNDDNSYTRGPGLIYKYLKKTT